MKKGKDGKEFAQLNDFPRVLTKDNVDMVISDYVKMLHNNPVKINSSANTIYGFLKSLKRDALNVGPYSGLTLFESANRIMTDLVVLYGVKELLEKKNINGTAFDFDSYTVEFGNENNNVSDVMAEKGNIKLYGEAFNVAKSFFQGKKSMMLKKMRNIEKRNENDYLLLLVNSDALSENYSPKLGKNEFLLPVDIDL